MNNMKKIGLLLVLLMGIFCAKAQNKTILLTESNLPYTSQTWFYSGSGNALQEDKIKKHWDEGRRITSVAHTKEGWFVTMAKSTGIGMQTYTYSADWPKDWIKKKWDENYYITSIAKSTNKWLVVMSKGIGYTDQSWSRNSWSEQKKWYNEKRDEGYFITSMTYDGTYWTLVVSKGSPYSSQGYLWASSYDDLKSKIKKDVWDRSYNVHSIAYGDGEYFVVYGKYSQNNGRGQNYNVNPADITDYINKRWDEKQDIAHIGGGYYEEPAHNHNHNNNNMTYNNGLGTVTSHRNADGSLSSVHTMKCVLCGGTGVCGVCFGRGGNYNSYTNLYYPCNSCFGSTRCKYCNGTGTQTMTTHVNPDGSGYGVGAGGVVTTGPGGNITSGGGSNNGSNSRRKSSSNGVCPDCNGKGYRPQAYKYAASSSFAPYHNSGGSQCYICGEYTDHYHYRCTTCKRR